MELTDQQHDIVPAHLAVKAMRDSGYKNAAYALAELMDNAIQAGASEVELLCGEHAVQLRKKRVDRVKQIAVLDDGEGMNADVLRMALQFGNGTHLTPEGQRGIGKFGMGLPNASISQCKHVDVWSWQNGPDSALYTYLDIDEIQNQNQTAVPTPRQWPIRDVWRTVGRAFGRSGTLVVWSRLDRVVWKTARAIIHNSERLIGRMYRKFLDNGKTRIRLCAFDLDDPGTPPTQDEPARPNDPTYLMADTSCPYDGEPMFQTWGNSATFDIADADGNEHEAKVTFTYAREESREGHNPGGETHGKHAKKNMGVSVVRAGRELELDESWNTGYDPTDRWWGVEVEFPPALDDVFGVSNNKQAARHFHRIEVDALKENGETVEQLKTRLREEEHPSGPLLDVSLRIANGVNTLRDLLKKQTKGNRKPRTRYEEADQEAEKHATKQTEKRKKEGFFGQSDEQEKQPDEQRTRDIADELKGPGRTEEEATRDAVAIIEEDAKYRFMDEPSEEASFFSITSKGGKVFIKLNTNHPAHRNLVEILEDPAEDAGDAELRDRLKRARNGLRLLLMAWARYEDESKGPRRDQAQELRFNWGSIAHHFMDDSG